MNEDRMMAGLLGSVVMVCLPVLGWQAFVLLRYAIFGR